MLRPVFAHLYLFQFFISIELVTKRNHYICVSILIIDLESLLMSIFRLGSISR